MKMFTGIVYIGIPLILLGLIIIFSSIAVSLFNLMGGK